MKINVAEYAKNADGNIGISKVTLIRKAIWLKIEVSKINFLFLNSKRFYYYMRCVWILSMMIRCNVRKVI